MIEKAHEFKQYDFKPKNFKQVFGYTHHCMNVFFSVHACPKCGYKAFVYAANIEVYWCLGCDSYFKDEVLNA